jgi:hypothetical protein
MTMLNGQPIGDPAPRATVAAKPATPAPIEPATFILSLLALIFAIAIPLAGAIMGGIAMAQSRRAGQTNTIAKVAFWLGLVLTVVIVVVTVVSVVFGVGLFSELFRVCGQLGEGTHEYNGITYSCD